MDDDNEIISKILSNAVHYTIGSRHKALAQRNQILILEFLYSTRNNAVVQRYFGGSSAEGTNLPESDIDKMIVASNIMGCENDDDIKLCSGHVFKCDTSECQPGYTRLKPVRLDKHLPTIFDDHGKSLSDMLETLDGIEYLSSDKMVGFWLNFVIKKNTFSPVPEYRHGPSATATLRDNFGYIKDKINMDTEQDFVYAIALKEWPTNAEEWFSRKRYNEWPEKQTIDKIKKLKCHVVAVADQKSLTASLEWRISYLLAERELIWNFNDTQIQCFILMKILLKKFLRPVAHEELSSYHMKMIVFWESENRPFRIWQSKNLLHCIHNCLAFLHRSVQDSKLPHYFHRLKNLFEWKLKDRNTKRNITEVINKILSNLVPSLLECIEEVDLLTIWKRSDGNAKDFFQFCRNTHDSSLTSEFEDFIPAFELFHYGFTSFGVSGDLIFADFHTLSIYHQAFDKRGSIDDVNLSFQKSVQAFINIRIAIATFTKYFQDSNDKPKILFEKLQMFLEKQLDDIDALSGRMYLATFFIRIGENQKAHHLIQHILFSKTQNLVYSGKCSKCYTITILNGTVTQVKALPKISDDHKGYLSVAKDIIFSKDDISFVPYAVKFECMIDKVFLIHPVVYMYYLAIQCCPQDRYETISSFEKAVEECSGSLHSYRHLNLLGHCFFLNKDYSKAYDCYRSSLVQTIITGRSNAAIYHLIILVSHLLQNKQFEETEIIYQRQ